MQIGQNSRRKHIYSSQQVVSRDHLVEAKLVKELPLISVLPPHHCRISCRLPSRIHCSLCSSSVFRQHRSKPEVTCIAHHVLSAHRKRTSRVLMQIKATNRSARVFWAPY